jgi:hypothetical protein
MVQVVAITTHTHLPQSGTRYRLKKHKKTPLPPKTSHTSSDHGRTAYG